MALLAGFVEKLSTWNRVRLRHVREKRSGYYKWMNNYEKEVINSCLLASTLNGAYVESPLISIVMPVYNPSTEHLTAAIESVIKQIYTNWELRCADDCSTDPEVRLILEKYEKLDSRIKVVYRGQNGHISAASNSALAQSKGEFIALMDQDDLIPSHALWLVKDAIQNHPDVALIYSDEDKVDNNGNRYDPYFKSNWNRHLLESQNMFSHLGVYSRELLEKVGGFRLGFEGSQDYDLILRCVDELEDASGKIIHIPHILYHWRVHPGSTAYSADCKPYAMTAGLSALSDHLNRRGVNANVESHDSGAYRIEYQFNAPEPKVAIIFYPEENADISAATAIQALIEQTDYESYDIWIKSGLIQPELIESFNDRVKESPHIESELNSIPLEKVCSDIGAEKYEFICFLNSALPSTGLWLKQMVGIAVEPTVAVVGGVIENVRGIVKNAGYIIGGDNVFSPRFMGEKKIPIHNKLVQELSAVSSHCLLVKYAVFCEVGGFSIVNIRPSAKDVDFCLKISDAGYKIVWTPHSKFVCSDSLKVLKKIRTLEKKRTQAEFEYYENKWGRGLKDKYLNPNYMTGCNRYRINPDRI